MLQDQKGTRPLCIWLDTNKWIELSRAHYGPNSDSALTDLLATLRAAVANGSIVLPFGLVQALEALKCGDAERRDRLIRFLVDLSDNKVVRTPEWVRQSEVKNAFSTLANQPQAIEVRASLVQTGCWHLFGELNLNAVPEGLRDIFKH